MQGANTGPVIAGAVQNRMRANKLDLSLLASNEDGRNVLFVLLRCVCVCVCAHNGKRVSSMLRVGSSSELALTNRRLGSWMRNPPSS